MSKNYTYNNNDINPNKQKKYSKALETLLNKHRIKDKTDTYNFISIGDVFRGKYFFDKKGMKELYPLVDKATRAGVNYSIAQKPKEYGPLIVDIDLEYPYDEDDECFNKESRLYDDKLIENVIEIYRESMNHYLDIDKDQLTVIISEKPEPTFRETYVKDGFHLLFNEVCVHKDIRQLIRTRVVKSAEKMNLFENFSNTADKIIDKAVVASNHWLIYGNSKPKCKPYLITKIYNHKNKDISFEEYFDENNPPLKKMCLQHRRWKESNADILSKNYSEETIEEEIVKQKEFYEVQEEFIPTDKDEDYIKAEYLTTLLSDERADDYFGWLRTGWALHNISIDLLGVWIEFSQRSNKFKEGECESLWNNMRDGFSMISLAKWAKEDNPLKYAEFFNNNYDERLRESINCSTYHIAKAFYTKYYDRFAHVSDIKDCWYEFRRHRWYEINKGEKLMRIMSEEFANDYILLANRYNKKAMNESGDKKEQYLAKGVKFNKIVSKLMDIDFKSKILRECRVLFNIERFSERLDENKNLIGFENGVYDLETNEFRDGRPDDYLTFSTRNEYIKYNSNNPVIKQINKFFSQIMVKKDVREYFLKVLSICAFGHNREEKFYILTGCGSNGKSLTFDLMKYALGDYYTACNVKLMTGKRTSAGQTNSDLASTKGKRCGVFQEPDNDETLNCGVMKEMTGNDSFVVRDLFEKSKEIKPQIKYFFVCNDLPIITGRDNGTWRRIRVIDFNSKFVQNPVPENENEFRIDVKLKEKINSWGGHFMGYLIHIYLTKYNKCENGLEEPTEVLYSTNAYKKDSDHFLEYFENRFEPTEDGKGYVKRQDIITDFKAWHRDFHSNEKTPRPEALYKFLNEQVGKETQKGWRGIRFQEIISHQEEGEDDEEEVNDLDY